MLDARFSQLYFRPSSNTAVLIARDSGPTCSTSVCHCVRQ